MSYLVLARKWRPQTFEEIVGQEHISTTLQNAIKADRVAHAFLFTGVRGVGKTTAARILAKALNCQDGPTATPCNRCVNCTEITAGTSVDVLEIDGASNTGVDDIREIIENVRYRPSSSRFKIYIIDEVHMLSTSAFNALLKTLEEPPAHVKFIFATTDPHKVPHTIHSRCQRYDFKRISYQQIVDRLALIAKADGIDVAERALFLVARESEGSMRDAQSLFDQVIAYAGNEISDAAVSAALGLADHERIFQLGTAIARRDPLQAIDVLNQLYDFGYDLRRLTRDLLEFFRHLTVAKVLPNSALLADLPPDDRERLSESARDIGQEELDRAFRILVQTEGEVARVPYPKLVLDMAVLKLATLAPILSGDEILRRIDALPLGGGPDGGTPSPSGSRSSAASESHRSGPMAREPRPRASFDSALASAPEAGPPSWPGFLEFVGREKVALTTYLETATPPDWSSDTLVLAVPAGYFHDYLAQPEPIATTTELASRYFGRPMRVSVKAREDPAGTARAPTVRDLRERALGDPIVQAAVEIFGGQLQEVRPRRRAKRGIS